VIASTVPLSLLFAALASPASAAPERDCIATIRALRDAGDWMYQEEWNQLIWMDGFHSWPGSGKEPWTTVDMAGGPHPKYHTFLRDLRTIAEERGRKVVTTKEISQRLWEDSYTGNYTVAKVRYTCEDRQGEWRVFSREVTSRTDLVNPQVARQWRRRHSNR
jgi:hypothetical protein